MKQEPSDGVRLQKALAQAGVASRRASEELIAAGRVEVNGKVVTEQGMRVDPERDTIRVDGSRIPPPRRHLYLVLNKPRGVVSTMDDPDGRPTLEQYVPRNTRLFHVGRLDTETEGLLLLTNDGDLTARLTHPSGEVNKSYIARVSLQLTDEELNRLRFGIMIDGRKTAKAGAKILKQESLFTDVLITIHEGRNRQIRRMVEALGHQVIRLKRVKYGPVELGALARGEWRELSAQEVSDLRRSAGLSD